jgi:hypothetical protein
MIVQAELVDQRGGGLFGSYAKQLVFTVISEHEMKNYAVDDLLDCLAYLRDQLKERGGKFDLV